MADDAPGQATVADVHRLTGGSDRRIADFWKFHGGWDERVRLAIAIIVCGTALLAASSVFVLPAGQWITPSLIVAYSIFVLLLSRRYWRESEGDGLPNEQRRVSASAIYTTTIMAEVLQLVSLPLIGYWVWMSAHAGADWMGPAGTLTWWMAAYGTMQMAKRVGAGTLLLVMFSAQSAFTNRKAENDLATMIQSLQERIAQLEQGSSQATHELS